MIKNSDIAEYYDQLIPDYHKGYETRRWFSNSVLRADFNMTLKSILYHLRNVEFSNVLEVGPGPGTWTEVIFSLNPKASFDMVDISNEMRLQFLSKDISKLDNFNYIIGDFEKFGSDKKYDLFFSSRALEYFDNKELFFENAVNHLNENGLGFVITKNKDYYSTRNELREIHHKQLSTKDIQNILEKKCKEVTFFPVVVRLPFFSRFSGIPSMLVHKILFKKPMKNWINGSVESYLVIFKK